MMQNSKIDWVIIGCVLLLVAAGLVTMASFGESGGSTIVSRQLIFLIVSLLSMGVIASFDISFIKKSSMILVFYGIGIALLVGLFIFGSTVKGATSWFDFGIVSFQPADIVKLFLILVLAKYLSRRHVEIARWKHLIITGLYFALPFGLILVQPDFGSAIILLGIWFGMLLVSGLSRKHLLIFSGVAVVLSLILWFFVFDTYQHNRIKTFIHPTADITGAGYNVYQSTIAVGSGQLLGKGIGHGTQSRLNFLPENETDFIFASFAEEWGFIGSLIVIILFVVLLWRIIRVARYSASTFESFVAIGIVAYLTTHIVINIGMNIGLMPVTGVTLPFMSHGGSHLITEFIAIGVVLSIYRFRSRAAHRDDAKYEFLGYRS